MDYSSSEEEDIDEEEEDKPKAIKVGKKAKNESDSGSDVSFHLSLPKIPTNSHLFVVQSVRRRLRLGERSQEEENSGGGQS